MHVTFIKEHFYKLLNIIFMTIKGFLCNFAIVKKYINIMKRFILMSLAMAFCFVAAMAQPKATFKESSYDFGTIKESKGPVKHTFEVVNTGDKPLLIIDAVASCGCTRPTFSVKPIKPGKKGKVQVTFSPAGRAGNFKKTIKVKTNTAEKVSSLVITGVIIPKSKE